MKSDRPSKQQLPLPGVRLLVPVSRRSRPYRPPLASKRILGELRQASGGARDVAEIYRHEVLPVKTRTIRLLGRKAPAKIMNTLLGFEVQAAYKRVPCPDLITARYLKVFTELGCRSIKLPYDITITDRIVPELELAANRLAAGVRELFPGDRSLQVYVMRKICAHLRSRILSGGADQAQSKSVPPEDQNDGTR